MKTSIGKYNLVMTFMKHIQWKKTMGKVFDEHKRKQVVEVHPVKNIDINLRTCFWFTYCGISHEALRLLFWFVPEFLGLIDEAQKMVQLQRWFLCMIRTYLLNVSFIRNQIKKVVAIKKNNEIPSIPILKKIL